MESKLKVQYLDTTDTGVIRFLVIESDTLLKCKVAKSKDVAGYEFKNEEIGIATVNEVKGVFWLNDFINEDKIETAEPIGTQKEEFDNVFTELNKVKLNIEKKGRFNYASWTEAWKEVKKRYPNSTFTVYTTEAGFPAFINATGGFVKVGVTINDLEYIEFHPIMNNYNKSIQKDMITTFDINNSIKRCLVKALAYHGLGLYIYEGDDLPEDE